ncbi:MAG: RNA-binding protein [Thermoplasmata archaeon]
MTEFRFRKRHRLRQKEVAAMAERISSELGTSVFGDIIDIDLAEGPGLDAVYVGGKILALVVDGVPFLTVRGLLAYGASKRYVTVDMGAVRFVYNGADVMGPGIVDCDPDIQVGDLVWVRDVNNKRPLAVGKALMSGREMLAKPKGKAVKSIHHVGDRIWALDEPQDEGARKP